MEVFREMKEAGLSNSDIAFECLAALLVVFGPILLMFI